MPITEVIFYQEADGHSPVVEWLEELRCMNAPAFAKCTAVIQRLAADGHALRRPTADILRDGIHELRAKHGRVNYRILYFFHGRNVAILAHGITKEAGVPPIEIERAVRRKQAFASDPDRHTYRE
ncbi:MAG: type II toxin-antitoxin system RelE/ParE family toxin [Planctomycetes bacterium]|nr:type II toxin-antitoxin system RelE/ParE family toxin [Planctomycetota bacterium]